MSWQDLIDRCGSPSEKAFVGGLASICTLETVDVHERDGGLNAECSEFRIVSGRHSWSLDFVVYAQWHDSTGVADFAIIESGCVDLFIEIDGHDFHDRTKQQAARDRAKDRARLRSEAPTIRFTGSEVFKDPVACAREAVQTLWCITERRRALESDAVGQAMYQAPTGT